MTWSCSARGRWPEWWLWDTKLPSSALPPGNWDRWSPHHGFSWAHTEKDMDDALERIDAAMGDAVRN